MRKAKHNAIRSRMLFCLLIISLGGNCSKNSNPVKADISKEILGSWRSANLTVNTQRGQHTITIDTNFDSSTFNEIITADKDSIRFYVADSVATSLDSLEYRTVYSPQSYSTADDSLFLYYSDGTINVRVVIIQDTMVFYFKVDSQCVFAQKYGLGTLEKKYVRYTGETPPSSWPPLF
jgi:hypothetical protein